MSHASAAKLAWPAAVEAAFKRKYPNATVKAVSKETDAGQTTYEVESVDAGKRRDLVYQPDGTVVDYEEELKASEVPAAVLAAIKTRYPKATITAYWHLFTPKDGSVNYEIDLKGAGSVAEVVLTPEGKWISPKDSRGLR